jgi:hypothetical protein
MALGEFAKALNALHAKGVAMTAKHRPDSVTIDERAVNEVLVPRR